MTRRLLLLLALAALLLPAAANAFTVSGRFLYEDRRYDGNGYTGAVQNLPIRRAKVEVVNAITMQALATGATDAAGNYALAVTGQLVPVSLYVRCTTDGRQTPYHIRVYDNLVRVPTVGLSFLGASLYSITTATTTLHNPANDLVVGDYLIQDTNGTGVAQAFNIFDCAVDFWDWVATVKGSLPAAADSIAYAWNPNGTPGNPPPAFGSNYSQQGIFIGSNPNSDTDGWSDTVILHETGHWFDDMYSRSDNPGGEHFIGDNDADVKLAYGEGSATYHCAKVREWRSSRLNLVGQPIDRLVSLYADLEIPPPVGTPGALSFSYDFETGNFANTGLPIGQRGSANETNVTSALWDLMDGPGTPDASPGVDDDAVEVGDNYAWAIEHDYLRSTPAGNAETVEDYYQGWFALNGPGFMQSGMDGIFVTLAKMPFYADVLEPDNTIANAHPVTPLPHTLAAGHVVINELDLGPKDAIELYNGSADPVDLTGWKIEVFANGLAPEESLNVYTFPPFTLEPGEVVAVHEAGTPVVDDGQIHLYAGDQQAFNASWNNGLDGACLLLDAAAQPVDFVKWRAADGTPNHTAVPAGASFSGLLDTPPAPGTIARDIDGTDTDSASDFSGHWGSIGSVNHPSPTSLTVFGIGDQDVFSFTAAPNTRYGLEARSFYSASDAFIELLNGSGQVIGSNDNSDVSVRDARLDFYAATGGNYYVRVTHVGANTDWAEYDLIAFIRPPTGALLAPAGLAAAPDHASDTADPVHLQWVNASTYDSVRVYRDGTRIAALAGGTSQYTDQAARGLHQYEVSGVKTGTETGKASDYAFAGIIGCFAADDFETGMAANWVKEEAGPGNRWGVTPLSQSGTFGFTDSPAGLYRGCPVGTCPNNTVAEFAVPARLRAHATLQWDQIVVTEAGFDYGIVELSKDGGASWIELARYDMSSDARWADMTADPGDWRHESIDLQPWVNELVNVRYRLQADANLEFDGWYVDNVQVGDASCNTVAVGDPTRPTKLEFLAPTPNPVRGSARFAFALPAREERVDLAIYDVGGRVVRYERLGARDAGYHSWTWDGRDGQGRTAASGAYFARLVAGGQVLSRKLLKLAP